MISGKVIRSRIHLLRNQWSRLKRHGRQFVRYATLRKTVNIFLAETCRIAGFERCVGMPYVYMIDPSNICNLRCPLCTTGLNASTIEKTVMSLATFTKIVDEISPFAAKIYLYKWGEPFLHKDIIAMISYVHAKRIATLVSSNLNVLPKTGAEALVRSGLDDLIVSCDGLTQETYEQYRRGGSLDAVKKNLKEIAACKKRLGTKRPRIEMQYLVFEHNEHEVERVVAAGKEWGADIVRLCSPITDWTADATVTASIRPAKDPRFIRPDFVEQMQKGKKIKEAFVQKSKMKKNCFWPWRAMVINCNGLIDPCCYNEGDKHFGNVSRETIRSVWNNEAYRYARRCINGKSDPGLNLPIVCERCPGAL